jgi:hypothetical protein
MGFVTYLHTFEFDAFSSFRQGRNTVRPSVLLELRLCRYLAEASRQISEDVPDRAEFQNFQLRWLSPCFLPGGKISMSLQKYNALLTPFP